MTAPPSLSFFFLGETLKKTSENGTIHPPPFSLFFRGFSFFFPSPRPRPSQQNMTEPIYFFFFTSPFLFFSKTSTREPKRWFFPFLFFLFLPPWLFLSLPAGNRGRIGSEFGRDFLSFFSLPSLLSPFPFPQKTGS